jgi:hypothetical protein
MKFAGTRDTVAIPFGCRVVSTLPREHRRVVNGSFGDRFVEGIYLHADSQTPTIRMFDLASRTELAVKDFKSYPDEFPFQNPNYVYHLRRPLYVMPSAARAWHHTISAYLKSQGCKLVGFERSMWTVVKEGHVILITAHIDDFIIACADRKVLDEFRTSLFQRFESTY